MDTGSIASMVASVLIASSTAVFGAVLMVRGRATSPSPFVLCAVAGLLVGMSLLVVLPQATESLSEQGWKMETIFILFLASPMAMFFAEHIVVEHTHGGLHSDQTAHAHFEGGDAKEHQVHVINVSVTDQSSEPFKFTGVPDMKGSSPRARAAERAGLLSKGLLSERDADRNRGRERLKAILKVVSMTFGTGLRLLAWLVHAALDGVLLATSKKLSVLIPLTLAVAICSFGDMACLYVYLSARKCSERWKVIVIVSFCSAYPLGTGVTILVLKEAPGIALNILRAVLSGLFIYVGFFELMPPVPHGQMHSLKFFLAFSTGLVIAYLGDVIEDNVTMSLLHKSVHEVREAIDNQEEPHFLHGGIELTGAELAAKMDGWVDAAKFGTFAISVPSPPAFRSSSSTEHVRYPMQDDPQRVFSSLW